MDKKEGLTRASLISKISNHDDIESLSQILRDFLKHYFNIHNQLTFEEIKENITRKHVKNEIQAILAPLCDNFTHLEYRPKNPTKEEISKLKSNLKKLIRLHMPKLEEKKPSLIIKKIQDIQKHRQQHLRIKKKIEDKKNKIKNKIFSEIKERKEKRVFDDDKEVAQIKKFISTSLELGMGITEIKKDLKEMGFEKNKIDFVIIKIGHK